MSSSKKTSRAVDLSQSFFDEQREQKTELISQQIDAEKTRTVAPSDRATRVPEKMHGTSSSAIRIGDKLGSCKILSKIGAGGMGEVYKAHDYRLDRVVAIKVMQSNGQLLPRDRKRFYNEAKLTAKLQHPHIVSIYQVGAAKGHDCIIMDFIDGQPLNRFIKQGEVSLSQALALLRDVALAIDYAHRQGVVHRDLKPSNILVEKGSGRPVVMDFGLAKNLRRDDNLTQSGEIMGTPKYMAPEQALCDPITPATDIYSLGAILYEILTGVPPVDGDNPMHIFYNIIHCEVVPPRKHKPHLSAKLENICLKALEKEPQRRYAHARDFADDIQRFLQGKLVTARPVSIGRKLSKTLRQYKLATGLFAGGMCVCVVSWLWQDKAVVVPEKTVTKPVVIPKKQPPVAVAPKDTAEYWLEIGKTKLQKRKYNDAIYALTRAIDIDAKFGEAYKLRAKAYGKKGDTRAQYEDSLKANLYRIKSTPLIGNDLGKKLGLPGK